MADDEGMVLFQALGADLRGPVLHEQLLRHLDHLVVVQGDVLAGLAAGAGASRKCLDGADVGMLLREECEAVLIGRADVDALDRLGQTVLQGQVGSLHPDGGHVEVVAVFPVELHQNLAAVHHAVHHDAEVLDLLGDMPAGVPVGILDGAAVEAPPSVRVRLDVPDVERAEVKHALADDEIDIGEQDDTGHVIGVGEKEDDGLHDALLEVSSCAVSEI